MATRAGGGSAHSDTPIVTICVIGLSGTEAEKDGLGVGKSCLCNRFVSPREDAYRVDHMSILSAADFSGQIVNNDHFLYWGVPPKVEEGSNSHQHGPVKFRVIEQTEFIDDLSFAAFNSGKESLYWKRSIDPRIQSAEKLKYICKDQLGLEDNFEQERLTAGKLSVDGFVCVVDVCRHRDATFMDRQLRTVQKLLAALARIKKPVVIATTKNDDANEANVALVQKTLSPGSGRNKDLKAVVGPIVETSATKNVNVDAAFFSVAGAALSASGGGKSGSGKGLWSTKRRVLSYADALRVREETMKGVRQAFFDFLKEHVRNYRKAAWDDVTKERHGSAVVRAYGDAFGDGRARNELRMHADKLRKQFIERRKLVYQKQLPTVLIELIPELTPEVRTRNWSSIRDTVLEQCALGQWTDVLVGGHGGVAPPRSTSASPRAGHRTRCHWHEDESFLSSEDTRLPCEVLARDAEAQFKVYAQALEDQETAIKTYKEKYEIIVEEIKASRHRGKRGRLYAVDGYHNQLLNAPVDYRYLTIDAKFSQPSDVIETFEDDFSSPSDALPRGAPEERVVGPSIGHTMFSPALGLYTDGSSQ